MSVGRTIGATWVYFISDNVSQSGRIADYARIVKMLGAVRLELQAGWFHKILRFIFIKSLNWIFLFLMIFFLFISIYEYFNTGSGTWEILNIVAVFLLIYMSIPPQGIDW